VTTTPPSGAEWVDGSGVPRARLAGRRVWVQHHGYGTVTAYRKARRRANKRHVVQWDHSGEASEVTLRKKDGHAGLTFRVLDEAAAAAAAAAETAETAVAASMADMSDAEEPPSPRPSPLPRRDGDGDGGGGGGGGSYVELTFVEPGSLGIGFVQSGTGVGGRAQVHSIDPSSQAARQVSGRAPIFCGCSDWDLPMCSACSCHERALPHILRLFGLGFAYVLCVFLL
jgi:hypothetical protein